MTGHIVLATMLEKVSKSLSDNRKEAVQCLFE